MTDKTDFRCGYVAIVGRPNVGKSSLLNRILGQKISITAHRPQTTRHRILGIKTEADYQAIYVDTPGMHLGGTRAINRYMNREASSALADVDVVVFVVDRLKWTADDQMVLDKLGQVTAPVILVINKTDKLDTKEGLLPHMQVLAEKFPFAALVPLSARNGDGVDHLEREVAGRLRVGPSLFAEDQVTDRSERFIAAELVREKLIRTSGQEVPYSVTVEIEKFAMEKGVRHIAALIWVEREGQKAIVIGKQGERLKSIGEQARKDMERIFDGKVFLELWVKVKQGWSDDERALRSLGYKDGG